MFTLRKKLAAMVVILLLAGLVYFLLIQPWHLRWGATNAEVERVMPGDDLMKDATYVATRAVTIEAGPEDIWPWLAQMGEGRGGFYSYDVLERIVGCNISNADRIISEYQRIEAGDEIPFCRGGGMPVKYILPNQSLLLQLPGFFTWSFGLYPVDTNHTRLVVRSRWISSNVSLAMKINLLVIDPMHLVMERKMMLGIKERAEAAAEQTGRIATVRDRRTAGETGSETT